MKSSRKLMFGAMAVLLPIASVIMVASGTASAKKLKTLHGIVTCTTLTGTVTFTPPLVNGGSASEETTANIHIAGCKIGTKKAKPASGTVTISGITGTGATNSCTSLEGGGPPSPIGFDVSWGAKDTESVSSFGGYTIATQQVTGNEGFELPDSGDPTHSTTGSYADANSSSTAYSSQTAAEIASECGGAGLANLTISTGTATF